MNFKEMETSEILAFLNFICRQSKQKRKVEEYNLAVTELEKRSKLMAMLYK